MSKPRLVLRWAEITTYEKRMTLTQACEFLDDNGYTGTMPTTLTEAGKLIDDDQDERITDGLAAYQDGSTHEEVDREVEQAVIIT